MTRRESETLKAPGIAHGFFGREGGVSTGIYESRNCGPGSNDAPEAVAENRRRIAAVLIPGGEPPQLVSLSQVHSPIVHTLPAWGSETGKGILTADCAPVLLADLRAQVIGAAHAGWKGALGGVLEATVEAMEKLGAQRMRIQAVIGPSISQDAYEVGWDFRDRFLKLGLRNRRFFVPSDKEGHYRFDLPGYAAHRLTAAGAGSVESLGVCTYPPENGYFSFRRTTHAGEPDYGRQISAIVLTG